jgi:hypothetical protein
MWRCAVACGLGLLISHAVDAREKLEWGKLKGEIQRDLGSTNPATRVEGVRKLGRADCLEAAKMLVDLIDHPDPALRRAEAERDAYEKNYLDAVRRFERAVQQSSDGTLPVNQIEEREEAENRWRELNAQVGALSELVREAGWALGRVTDPGAIAWMVKTGPTESSDRVREDRQETRIGGIQHERSDLLGLSRGLASQRPT